MIDKRDDMNNYIALGTAIIAQACEDYVEYLKKSIRYERGGDIYIKHVKLASKIRFGKLDQVKEKSEKLKDFIVDIHDVREQICDIENFFKSSWFILLAAGKYNPDELMYQCRNRAKELLEKEEIDRKKAAENRRIKRRSENKKAAKNKKSKNSD